MSMPWNRMATDNHTSHIHWRAGKRMWISSRGKNVHRPRLLFKTPNDDFLYFRRRFWSVCMSSYIYIYIYAQRSLLYFFPAISPATATMCSAQRYQRRLWPVCTMTKNDRVKYHTCLYVYIYIYYINLSCIYIYIHAVESKIYFAMFLYIFFGMTQWKKKGVRFW